MYIRILCAFFISFSTVLIHWIDAGSVLGPGNIKFHHLEPCPGKRTGPMDMSGSSTTKVGAAGLEISGFVNLPFDLDENISLEFNCQKRGDGGWRPNAYRAVYDDVCKSSLKLAPGLWRNILTAANIPSTCPVKAGNYSFNKLILDLNDNKIPMLLYGDFRADVSVIRENRTAGCVRLVYSVNPK